MLRFLFAIVLTFGCGRVGYEDSVPIVVDSSLDVDSDGTTADASDAPDGHTQTCATGRTCFITCPVGDVDCAVDCDPGSDCAVETMESTNVTITCASSSTCAIECLGNSVCEAACNDGAECVMHCSASSSCRYTLCAAGVTMCTGNILVCNAACP